ncbi:transcriptional regulator [Microbispora sp. NPDC049125]|uniref:transcriptional regulator n=1 Tax=Microbispora sp. NPDC049125 TaxID=3154929 RepID=UPI003467895E
MRDLPGWAARLRAERRERLWTQRDMAKHLAEAADARTRDRFPERESLVRMIKDWEAGRHQPKDPYRVLYSRAFDISEDELFGNPRLPQGRTPAEILHALLREPDPFTPSAGRKGRRLGESTVEDLAARVHGVRLADDVIAGKDLIRPAFRELDAAVRTYRHSTYTEAVGRSLLAIIGEFAQIAGWVASDAGEHDKAARTYRLGIRAAHEAGDRTLESNLIGSLAYQVTNVGDPHEGTELARAAVEVAGPSAPARARALAWDRLAWAHTRAGRAQEAIHALGAAEAALADHGGEDEPGYLYWVDANELQIMEARAYTELRRPLRAVPLLTEVLSRYDATHTREVALYLSWLAVALADANEPEEAACTAARLLDLSADVASDRTARRVAIVLERLKPYRDVPQVRELLVSAPSSSRSTS